MAGPGNYRSEEVQADYRIVLEDGKLLLKHENDFKRFPKNALDPTVKDSFLVQGISSSSLATLVGKCRLSH